MFIFSNEMQTKPMFSSSSHNISKKSFKSSFSLSANTI